MGFEGKEESKRVGREGVLNREGLQQENKSQGKEQI